MTNRICIHFMSLCFNFMSESVFYFCQPWVCFYYKQDYRSFETEQRPAGDGENELRFWNNRWRKCWRQWSGDHKQVRPRGPPGLEPLWLLRCRQRQLWWWLYMCAVCGFNSLGPLCLCMDSLVCAHPPHLEVRPATKPMRMEPGKIIAELQKKSTHVIT